MNENQHDDTPGTSPDGGTTEPLPANEAHATTDAPQSEPQSAPGAQQPGAGTGPQPGAQTGSQSGPQGSGQAGPQWGQQQWGQQQWNQQQWGQQRSENTGDRLLQDLRALRRSRDDRVIAGVCGGVARQLGLDPLLVRVVTGVLMFFGAGIVLYALGWLLLPTDDGSPSVGEQAVARGAAPSSTSTILLAVALAVVAALGLGAAFSHWDGPFLFFLALGGLLAWLILRDRRGEVPVAPAPRAQAYAGATSNSGGQATAGGTTYAAAASPAAGVSLGKAPQGFGQPTGPAASNPLPTYQPRSPYQAPSYQAPGYATPGYATPGYEGQGYQGHQPPAGPPSGPYGAAPRPVTPPPPPAPRRPRSALFSVTMSLVLVGLGTLKLIDLSGTPIVDGAYPALALAIIAAALVVGAWFGRSRGLIAMGIIAALLTFAVSAADQWDNGRGNHVNIRVTPSSASELPTQADYSSGSVRYDLRGIDFTGVDRSMEVSMGAGEIIVIVPRDVDVTGNLSMGIGEVDFFGDSRGGFPSDVTLTNLGDDGPGGGSLELDLQAGVGHLEVRRG
jgi:phage shock protein PspC (stress-responsive transcriptional regulator)